MHVKFSSVIIMSAGYNSLGINWVHLNDPLHPARTHHWIQRRSLSGSLEKHHQLQFTCNKLQIANILYLKDELRVAGGDLFDIHTSLWAAHHDRAIVGPVHKDGKVGLPADVQSLSHHHLDTQQQLSQAHGFKESFHFRPTRCACVQKGHRRIKRTSKGNATKHRESVTARKKKHKTSTVRVQELRGERRRAGLLKRGGKLSWWE